MSSRRVKRQGTIEVPRGTIKTEQSHVIANKKHMIITEFHTQDGVTIYIGSETIYCIDVLLRKIEGSDVFEPIGLLSKIRWDGECSLNDPFEKGSDTIMIFQLIISYLRNKYPDVKVLQFTDLSTRACDNGASVSLAAMKLFTDGKTWYEDRFEACIDPLYEEIYNKMKSHADTIKKTMSWDVFSTYLKNDEKIIDNGTVQTFYEETTTWQDFFSKIRDTVDKSKFCIWLSTRDWFDSFLMRQLNFNIMGVHFIINIPEFKHTIEYELTTKGGKLMKKYKGIRKWKNTLKKVKCTKVKSQ